MHHNRNTIHLRTLVTDRYKLTVYRHHPEWDELYDLASDSHERQNRAQDPAWTDVRQALYRRLIDADLAREWAPTPRVAHA